MDRTECDECYGIIIDGECPCGVWFKTKDQPNFMRLCETVIYGFDHLKNNGDLKDIFSGDHHTGNCMIMFTGDYEMCCKARQFIEKLQNEK